MVSTTFLNLNEDKRTMITRTILDEFSKHPLSDAKVSRIVKNSGIARGAFYKYFDDLTDAYKYIYHLAIEDIHADFQHDPSIKYTPEQYLSEVTAFVDQVDNSQYYDLIKMHITANDVLLDRTDADGSENVMLKARLDAYTWANAVLTHETIKSIFLHPNDKDFLLNRYHDALSALYEKEVN